MKKTAALIFCFIFLFSSCSSETEKNTELNKDNYASYVGAGEMTLINILINSNAEIVNDILIANHLPVDETKTVKNTNGTFAPVVSEKYKSVSDIKNLLHATYTKNGVENILEEFDKYADIDGKLYFNMKYKNSDYNFDWSQPEVSAQIDAQGNYIISIIIKDEKGKDVQIKACAVTENESVKLDKIYY